MEPEDVAFEAIAAQIPEGRYRVVLKRVLDRLPVDWDYYRTFTIELAAGQPLRGPAHALREEALESADDDPKIEGHQSRCG